VWRWTWLEPSLPDLDLAGALQEALRAREAGDEAVLVNVVANRSDLPLSLNRRLLLRSTGEMEGSIHPKLDELLINAAREALREKRSRLRSFEASESGATMVGAQEGNLDVFFEVLARAPRLLVVGAGHIAVPLAALAKILEFSVTVVDDRPDFANTERFPSADSVLLGPYRETVAGMSVDEDTYAVLVTRGHVHDQACLEELLRSDVAYIGMIGSKRRVRTVLDHLRQQGAGNDKLTRVWAPIGLDLGAQTPAEIALAIMAEIVKVRRGGSGQSLALTPRS
jgi:xanthine dehydrogenase accessory factor